MNNTNFRSLGVAVLAAFLCGLLVSQGLAQQRSGPVVRIAELEIAPAQLARYKAAVTEEIETSIRVEPGVVAIYSVALKDNPSHLRFFEIYADERAYRRHLESPHFKKYVDITKSMITARRLRETVPIVLGSKAAPGEETSRR